MEAPAADVPEWPLSTLNDMMMARLGIRPTVELISHEVNRGASSFMMRITSPISPGGPLLSADGPYCSSKQYARHAAALTFMEKYLDYRNHKKTVSIPHPDPKPVVVNPPPTEQSVPKVVCSQNNSVNIEVENVQQEVPNVPCVQIVKAHASAVSAVSAVTSYSEEFHMLEAICLKNNLGEPEVDDVCIAGPGSGSTFTADCKVNGLCIEGEGKSESKARLHAIVRMIQLLTGTASVPEILKSTIVRVSKMRKLALESFQNEMAVSSGSCNGSQPALQVVVNNEQSGNVRPPENLREKPAVETNPVSTKSQIELMKAHKQGGEIEDGNNNSVTSNMNRMQMTENSEKRRFLTKPNGRTLNNDMLNCVEVGVGSTTFNKLGKNATHLQALSRITRTLGNLEKQLHEQILDTLVYCDLPHRHSVEFLSHNYDLFLCESSSPDIFEGQDECIDPSIRVACLTKVLMGLKQYVEINDRELWIR